MTQVSHNIQSSPSGAARTCVAQSPAASPTPEPLLLLPAHAYHYAMLVASMHFSSAFLPYHYQVNRLELPRGIMPAQGWLYA